MNAKKICFVFALLFAINLSFSQGPDCANATPFCADDTGTLVFPNSTGTTSEAGPDYDCLATQPNPAWYFLQIDNSGDLIFNIEQNTEEDFTGTGIDVDFICWGPFAPGDNYCDSALLTPANQVACSYDPAFIENFQINGAVSGEIYVLLITNFSGDPGFIRLIQTNADPTDDTIGSTDCDIVPSTLGPDQDLCDGDMITLDGTTDDAVSYTWNVDTGSGYVTIPGETNPTLNIPVDLDGDGTPETYGGTYQMIVEDSAGNTGDDVVVITYHSVPTADSAVDIHECDTGGGSATFDLTINNANILGTLPDTDYTVTYHLTPADAENGDNPIATPNAFVSTANPQTIHARVSNNANTVCDDVITFQVFADTVPTIVTLTPLEVCDDDADGIAQFDLTLANTEAQGAFATADYTLSYHTSLVDAQNDANPIDTTNP